MRGIALSPMKSIFLFFNDLIICGTLFIGIYLKRIETKELSFKETNIALLKKEGILFPHIVYKQSYLETNRFTSAIYKENNNQFGMKYNKRGYALKINRGHAYYKDLSDCIKDYAAWQKIMMANHERHFNKKILTDEDYYFFLNNLVIGNTIHRYAEDPLYTIKLNKL